MSQQALRALAPAKINLGLRLGPPRPDGRHELVTVMQSISLADELLLEWPGGDTPQSAASTQEDFDEVICPGVDGPRERNLAALALAAFREATGWEAPPLRLTIAKHIPVAAGLGGGSGDAAAALRLAIRASGAPGSPHALESGLAAESLLALAASLGADVPAQLRPGRWLATGAGERLEQLPAPEPPFGVLVLPIATPLSTAAVYAHADRLSSSHPRPELERYREGLRATLTAGAALPPAELLVNDLEAAARSLCPAIDVRLEQARACDADSTLVSGSGPTVLALFAGTRGSSRAQHAAESIASSAPEMPEPITVMPVSAAFGEPGALVSQFGLDA
jgi:4-diphosphocytidyl-2-C-methyl-D-erythritol kinase